MTGSAMLSTSSPRPSLQPWTRRKIAHHFLVGSGTTPDTSTRRFYEEGTVPWVNTADLRDTDIERPAKTVTSAALDEHSALRLYPTGSLIVSMYGGVHAIRLGMLTSPAATNQACCALQPTGDLDPKFTMYWFIANRDLLRASALGGAQANLSQGFIAGLRVLSPPLDEQRRIAAELDEATAEIDTTLRRTRRLVDVLARRRMALIFDRVFKGEPETHTAWQDGRPWMGRIPTSWDVRRLRYEAKLGSGHTPSRSEPTYWTSCVHPWVTLADVSVLRRDRVMCLSETKERISDAGIANSSAVLHPQGTVFLSRTASVGFAGIMGTDMATSQDFATWTCGDGLDPEYLYFQLLAMRPELRRLVLGSTHQTIYMPDIRDLVIARPSLTEQQQIAARLKREVVAVDELVDLAERQVDLLERRRLSLIHQFLTPADDHQPSAELGAAA